MGSNPPHPIPVSAKEIFLEVCDLPRDQRTVILAEKCAGDDSLRAAVNALLDAHDRAGAFLAGPTLDRTSVPAPDTSAHPRQIGPYKLLQIIGEGGFGTVWMAEQETPVRRRVALKIIKLGMDTQQVIARFEAERQALAMMDHPNIAKVFDAGATETGRPYFVMELVTGVPVTEYCNAHKLDIPQRLELFAQICQAVQHAHQKGIIHRDLKPSNILVNEQDGRHQARIIDFGIAKATQSRLTEKTVFTEFRQMIGTPEYMSPEQAGGNLDVDTRSDIYSLGVLLYELLTGTTPFDGRELRSKAYAEIERVIREVEPPAPSHRLSANRQTLASVAAQRKVEPRRLNSMVQGELDWIVMKCLEKDRARRYESASALSSDISCYLSDEPVSAGPPGTTYRLRKFARRHKLAFAVATVVLVALGAGLALALYGMKQATLERDNAIIARNSEAEAREYERLNQQFLSDMFTSISPEEARGRPVLVKEILDSASSRLQSTPPAHPVVAASLHATFGQAYASLGLLNPALENLQRAIELYKRAGQDQTAPAAKTQATLGAVLQKLGRSSLAEPLVRDALAKQSRISGAQSVQCAEIESALAEILASTGRFDAADAIYAQTIKTFNTAYGATGARTITERQNLAVMHQLQGKYSLAEQEFRELLSQVGALGPEHPQSVNIMIGLSEAIRNQHRTDEAIEMYHRALGVSRKVYGVDHLTTLDVQQNVAIALDAMGRAKESDEMLLDAIERLRSTVGEDHPLTLAARANYAEQLGFRGKRTESEKQLRDISQRAVRSAGPDSELAVRTRGMHAWVLMQIGGIDESELIFRDLVVRAPKVIGEDHPFTKSLKARLGQLLSRTGKFEDAEPLLREAYETAVADGRAQRYAAYTSMYGWCLANQGKADQAIPVLLEADRVARSSGGGDKQMLLSHALALASCYDKLNDPESAEIWRKKREALGPVTLPSQVKSRFSTTRPSTLP